MAAKKASATKEATTPTKAGTKKAGVKKTAVKKAATPKAPAAKAETAVKSGTPKASTKKAAPKAAATTKKAAPKKAAVKINDAQLEFLKKVHSAGELGYAIGQKVEQRTIDALITRKLVKKGPKNKETGKVHYMLTKAGEKHLAPAAEATSTPPSA